MDPYSIIRKPVISERTTEMAENNKYVFEVDPRANKTQIREAIQLAFDVRVTDINTLRRKGKKRRLRTRVGGYTPTRKRAVVTLASGDKIEIFEGV